MTPDTRCVRWCVLGVLVLGLAAQAQYPPRGPYPTGRPPVGYPPGSYPPGPYPPDTYPRTGQPGRLPPGAIPDSAPSTGLPLPETKRVRRPGEVESIKDPDGVVAFHGVLRKLTKRSLLLETLEYGFLRFDLSTDTSYVDQQGAERPMSAFNAGDTLDVEVRRGDVDTVLRAILVEEATAEARKLAAAKPQPSTVHIPSSLDLSKEDDEGAAALGEGKGQRPVMRRGRPVEYTAEGKRGEWDGSDDEEFSDSLPPHPTILAARQALASSIEHTPEYIVREFTTRDESAGDPPDWKRAEALTVDLIVHDGVEEFRNARINGKALDGAPYEPGSSPATEFTAIVRELLAPSTAARFDQPREETVTGRTTMAFRFRVPRSRSPWKLQSGGRSETLAYQGTVWIDLASHRVVRIEKQAVGIPRDFRFSEVKRSLEFSFIRLNQRLIALPMHGESVLCGSAGCVRQVTDFRNYRAIDTFAGRE